MPLTRHEVDFNTLGHMHPYLECASVSCSKRMREVQWLGNEPNSLELTWHAARSSNTLVSTTIECSCLTNPMPAVTDHGRVAKTTSWWLSSVTAWALHYPVWLRLSLTTPMKNEQTVTFHRTVAKQYHHNTEGAGRDINLTPPGASYIVPKCLFPRGRSPYSVGPKRGIQVRHPSDTATPSGRSIGVVHAIDMSSWSRDLVQEHLRPLDLSIVRSTFV